MKRLDILDILGAGTVRNGPDPSSRNKKTTAPLPGSILQAAAALGMKIERRCAPCFNGAAHKNGCDTNPSLVFFPDSNRFKCMACGAGGDMIDLVRGVRGVGFQEAVNWIQANVHAGVAVAAASGRIAAAKSRVPDRQAVEVYSKLYQITNELQPDSPAGEYLLGRAIEPALAHKCGATEFWSPDEVWDELQQAFDQDRLQAAGLLSHSGNFLLANHRLLFFYFDDKDPLYLQARDITGESRCKELGLTGLSSPVPFNVDLFADSPKRVYVCEGCVDTLSALQIGLPAVGIPGVQGFRQEWFDRFRKVREVVVLFDNDDAGRKAAVNLRARFRMEGIAADVMHPRGVKDVNDLLRQKQKGKGHE